MPVHIGFCTAFRRGEAGLAVGMTTTCCVPGGHSHWRQGMALAPELIPAAQAGAVEISRSKHKKPFHSHSQQAPCRCGSYLCSS